MLDWDEEGGDSIGSQSLAQAPRPMANNHATTFTTNTNGNGLIGGDGGDSFWNSLTRQDSIYSVTLEDFQRPPEAFGSLQITPFNPFNPYAGNGNTGASEGGSDRGERMDAYTRLQAQAHHQAQQQQQQNNDLCWLPSVQQQQAQAQQAHQAQLLQAQADAVNVRYHSFGNGGGMTPSMNGNGGYTGMASAIAPGLGQMGSELGGTMALSLAANSPTQSAASYGVNGHGNGLSLSPVGSMRGRRAGPDGLVKNDEERKLKLMIKNRESAAKSRAQKLAYIVKLEAELTQLKEELSKLRKEKTLETLSVPVRVHDYSKLRRTSSSPF